MPDLGAGCGFKDYGHVDLFYKREGAKICAMFQRILRKFAYPTDMREQAELLREEGAEPCSADR